ncbi:MAG: hypothetical protein AB7V56_06490 [Candidatus Nitrosocosmicus sp.]
MNPPLDITWSRLAYSKDMIDTNLGDLDFPPKWRSSLTVYYYIVPDEETVDAYPNSRIIYLRLSSSITGWNPNEELLAARKISEETSTFDDLQKSIWQAILSDGWASKYWPCLGAIMQIAIYPPTHVNNVPTEYDLDDYPEIMDFEPKKRELFESITEGSEVLSGTSEKLSILKGNTKTQDSTYGLSMSASAGWGPFSASVSESSSSRSGIEHVNNRTTDTSRENRETNSYTTSYSQMYQLFNGYHLGTNRAVFVICPRPHTGSHTGSKSGETEFNLIDGQRKLEGIQDVFLVIRLPRTLPGFCVQASIDTGHNVMQSNTEANISYLVVTKDQDGRGPFPQGNPQGTDDNPDPHQPTTPTSDPYYTELVVTRRIIQSCGMFDENGNFTITKVPDKKPKVIVTWEDDIPIVNSTQGLNSLAFTNSNKTEVINQMNITQRLIIKSMISGFSAGNYESKEFTKSRTFRRNIHKSIEKTDMSVNQLIEMNYLSQEDANKLMRSKVTTIGDLFKPDAIQSRDSTIQEIRKKILEKFGI